ncbi:hypothetical protein ILYODFUR_007784 [Ilyodon furcidens]|uniref:Uncharacterized protein n=1 Tax=Ilyodon furcidens TaxID=33524 RepID=A0ABV0U4V0_9TELE
MFFITQSCFKLHQNIITGLSAVFLNFVDAVYSLMFSKKPLKPSQNSWIYTEIRLHTGELLLLIRTTSEGSLLQGILFMGIIIQRAEYSFSFYSYFTITHCFVLVYHIKSQWNPQRFVVTICGINSRGVNTFQRHCECFAVK